MNWYHYAALASLCFCLVVSLFHMLRLIRLGKPLDWAPSAGKTLPAIQYSFTGAMSPSKKESAFLHLPTYTAGILYHLGTFMSIFLFFFILVHVTFTGVFAAPLSGFFVITGGCGIGILIKRMTKKELRSLSSPDDYISNMLVTIFQLITALVLYIPAAIPGLSLIHI